MKKLTINKDHESKYLNWNDEFQRYELKIETVKANMTVNFVDDGVLDNRIKQTSKKVYNYIYSHCASANVRFITKLINNTVEGASFIFEALLAQIEADNENAYNDITKIAPVNTSNGQIIDRSEIQRNVISVDTEMVIDSNERFFGFNIMYQGCFPNWVYFLNYDN